MAQTLLVATAALLRMPSILSRSALTRYLAETSAPDVAVTWVEEASGAALQLRLWETSAASAASAAAAAKGEEEEKGANAAAAKKAEEESSDAKKSALQ